MGSGKGRANRVLASGPSDAAWPPTNWPDLPESQGVSSSLVGLYMDAMFDGIYDKPVDVRRLTGSGELKASWKFADGEVATFSTEMSPLHGLLPAEGHDVYNDGIWIGKDSPQEHIRFTISATEVLSAEKAEEIVNAYRRGDYGEGAAGFAVYKSYSAELEEVTIWLIDDAVRSSEGEPPARNPATSPGPLTVLTPADY